MANRTCPDPRILPAGASGQGLNRRLRTPGEALARILCVWAPLARADAVVGYLEAPALCRSPRRPLLHRYTL